MTECVRARQGLGRLSMWSLNRDRTCGPNYPDVRVVSNSCSGIKQGESRFATILRDGFTGTASPSASAPVADDRTAPAPVTVTDDPRSSPFPIWNEDEVYVEGTRVVWHRHAYAARWWTSGDTPDDPTVDAESSPWRLLGPVLPGEKPVPALDLPQGLYPTWDEESAYDKGERVVFDGVAFAASWWTSGDNPMAPSLLNKPNPWIRLTDLQVRQAIAASDE